MVNRVVVRWGSLLVVFVALGCSGQSAATVGMSACDPCACVAPAGTVSGISGFGFSAALDLDDVTNGLDDVFFGSPGNPPGVPFSVNPGPSSVGTANDAGIFYNDGQRTVLRYFDVRDLNVEIAQASNIANLAGQEINLVPSNFTPPDLGPGETWAYVRVPEGTPGLETASLPQTRTGPFPDDWLEDIANRHAREREQKAATTWKRSQIVPNTSELSVGENDDLPLEGMKASVQIDGFRARVVLDLLYRNDKDQQLSGAFKLRLPVGASIHYLAFGESAYEAPAFAPTIGTTLADIRETHQQTWTKPKEAKEARIVPKEKAAHAFAETVRQKVDPALLEWSGPGVFTANVFPLEPGKLHQVVVGYDVDLRAHGDDLVYRLDLPSGIPALEVEIAIHGVDAIVKPEGTLREGRHHWKNPVAHTFEVRVPSPGAILLTGTDPAAGPHFAARFRPEVPSAPVAGTERGVFLVDASLSSNPERFEVWLELLRALLEANRGQMREFSVGFFNIDTVWWQADFVANTAENVTSLMAYANDLALEGATDLGQALAAAAGSTGDFDVFLLSDGAATWGDAELYAVSHAAGDHAVFSYATGFAGTDKRMLAHLARETGGAVFTVTGASQLAKAAVAHTKQPWDIVDVKVAGGNDLLLAGRPLTLFPGQELEVVGRGRPAADAEIELTLAQGDRVHRIAIAAPRRIESVLTPGIYGQIAVSQLEALGGATEDVSKAYATHFRVVGQTCSLLMLESDEEYERFAIVPEDDVAVVRARLASAVVLSTLDAIAETLGDAKARLVASLQKLARAPGVTFEPTAALRRAIEAMPPEAFRVDAQPLSVSVRSWDDVPGSIQEQLASRELVYDDIVAEAERRREKHGTGDALRAMSSLVEANPGDMALARDVGYSALRWGLDAHAYHLFRRVAEMRPYEPQTYYAMARSLAKLGKNDLALVYYEIALAGTWDARFGEFLRIVSVDYLRFLRRVKSDASETPLAVLASERAPEIKKLAALAESDIVVVMAWNTDRTDVDLHVIDPNGEECFYSHTDTRIGGHLTQDVTQGYGPEMFTLPRAIRGQYVVKAKYFSSDMTRTSTRTRVFITIYEDFGRPGERVTRKTVTLTSGKEMHEVATLRR